MPRTQQQSGIAQQLHDILDFKLTAVCFDQGGYGEPSKWKVVITRPDGAVDSDYQMGCAYREWKGTLDCSGIRASYWSQFYKPRKQVSQACQVKKLPKLSWHAIEFNSYTQPIKPDLVDVVYSLMRDAQCGELTFKDFCAECGYNDDSISDQEIWHACRRIHQQVTRAKWPMEKLQELFQDY